MDPDPRKEIEVDPDPERGLKWIRPNAVDPDPKRCLNISDYQPENARKMATFLQLLLNNSLVKSSYFALDPDPESDAIRNSTPISKRCLQWHVFQGKRKISGGSMIFKGP